MDRSAWSRMVREVSDRKSILTRPSFGDGVHAVLSEVEVGDVVGGAMQGRDVGDGLGGDHDAGGMGRHLVDHVRDAGGVVHQGRQSFVALDHAFDGRAFVGGLTDALGFGRDELGQVVAGLVGDAQGASGGADGGLGSVLAKG